MVVVIKIITFLLFFFFYISNNVYASILLDYETEQFIKKINNIILSVNNYRNKIEFSIIFDENPNAFINKSNHLYISSGLIEKAPSYVSLLGVLAHEIGHLEKYHIPKRKKSIQNLKTLDMLGTLSIIAGTIVSNNPEIIQALVVNKIGINDFYINFSKDQEREADYYVIDTLNKLNLPPHSLIKLLNMLEEESLKKGITEEYQKFSTHPIFKERYQIIKDKKNDKNIKIDLKLEDEFNFIKAKFLGYSSENESDFKKYLTKPLHNYSRAILYSKKGDLKKSLLLINELIINNKENYYLYETKADILFSHGYKKEAVKFYKKVFNKYPKNKYVQIRIFNNTEEFLISKNEKNKFFQSNINLLFDFPKNKILYLKYKNISEALNKTDWVLFFNIYNIKDSLKKNEYINKLNYIINNSKEKNLIKLLKIHIKL